MTIAINKNRLDGRLERARERVEDLHTLQAQGLICKSGDFFPSVHYPPITMYQPMTEEEMFATYTMPADGLLDVYAHIPFCRSRCTFCHYPVKLGERSAEKDRYLAALSKEMDLYMRRLGISRIKARSILVGGGTPTYLALDQMEEFLGAMAKRIDIAENIQYNYDVDPVTLIGPEGIERLQMMRDYGVNRLTIGVQSLNEDILKRMHRHHGVAEVLESIENCKKLGFQLNIEFIFGYPGQNLENWVEVIEQAVKMDVDEIQLYRLKVEAYGDDQAPIKRVNEVHPEEVPSTEQSIMMKQMAIDILAENGFHENLRRVYTKKREHYSHYAHNQCCMLYDEVGFGLTAFSSLRDRFILNTQNFEEYYSMIENDRMPLNRGIVRSHEEQVRWAIILPLKNRTIWKSAFAEQTGITIDQAFPAKFAQLKAAGLIFENENEVGLTTLGCFFADEVVQQFHHSDYIPFPADHFADGPLHPLQNNVL
jgi:oxygen-independent coproporphyrinogen III oxidase